MLQERKHPPHCASASGEKCKCSHCAGTQHGWVGAFELARSGNPEDLREFEQAADQRWREECGKQDSKNQKQPKATLAHKRAAVDSARANLIKWLRERLPQGKRAHVPSAKGTQQDDSPRTSTPRNAGKRREPPPSPPVERTSTPADRVDGPGFDTAATDRALLTSSSEAAQVEALGCMLGQVLEAVEEEIGPLRPGTRQAMADHFWCELLVQLVVVIEKSNHLLDSVPDKVADMIIDSRRSNGFPEIQRKVIAACAREVWKRLASVLGLTAISDARSLLPALRTLAVLMCKSPPRHPAVVEHCLDPLKTALVLETKKRLQRVFGELVPQITSDVVGKPV